MIGFVKKGVVVAFAASAAMLSGCATHERVETETVVQPAPPPPAYQPAPPPEQPVAHRGQRG